MWKTLSRGTIICAKCDAPKNYVDKVLSKCIWLYEWCEIKFCGKKKKKPKQVVFIVFAIINITWVSFDKKWHMILFLLRVCVIYCLCDVTVDSPSVKRCWLLEGAAVCQTVTYHWQECDKNCRKKLQINWADPNYVFELSYQTFAQRISHFWMQLGKRIKWNWHKGYKKIWHNSEFLASFVYDNDLQDWALQTVMAVG